MIAQALCLGLHSCNKPFTVLRTIVARAAYTPSSFGLAPVQQTSSSIHIKHVAFNLGKAILQCRLSLSFASYGGPGFQFSTGAKYSLSLRGRMWFSFG
jgi:hypothetical protein